MTKLDRTRLQACLLSLSGVHSALICADRCLPRSREEDNKYLTTALTRYIVILLSSFLEEWKRFESLGKDDLEVRATLKVAEPFVERIRRWQVIPRIRSAILAHPFRSKDGAFAHPSQFQRVPATAEVWLLGLCAIRACESAVQRHLVEHEAALSLVSHIEDGEAEHGIRTIREVEEELKRVEEESKKIAAAIEGAG